MSIQQDYQSNARADQKSDSGTQTKEFTAHPRGADERHQMDMQMIQNVFVIWLDSSVNENSIDYENNVDSLHDVVSTVKIFDDNDECVDFLKFVAHDKVCIIISEAHGQQIVPLVHNMPQINSIFIFCRNEKTHEEWTKNWRKIKGVHNELKPICAKLKQIVQQCERNAISMSIIGDVDGLAEESGNRLDPPFMYTQIMKEIFLTITFENKHINEFIQHCREVFADNRTQLKCANELSETYDKHSPIWWYTRETFLYSMLNGALRTMNVDVIIKFGFFIVDLYREIKELHSEQFGPHGINQSFITVYRGQGMYIKEFEKMIANEGGLLSFNNFLSTSKDRDFCLAIADSNAMDCNLFGVLFVINIDPNRPSAPFAYVADRGYLGNQEEELLFSTHAVFRIGKNRPINNNSRLVEVELILTSDTDNDLSQLVDYIRQETFPDDAGWYRLGQVLRKMAEPVKAQQIYERLLEETTGDEDKALIYHQLGLMKYDQEEHAEAIAWYEKSIEIEKKQVSPRHKNLCMSYNNMGSVYFTTGDYRRAISLHQEALAIQTKSLPLTHPHLALSYIGIGTGYNKLKEYATALQFYEKARIIQEQALPPTHPHLAALYNNIGVAYDKMSNYKEGLSYFKKALTIQEQSLPSTHPDLAVSYGNIGGIYASRENYKPALEFYEKALAIEEKLPSLARLGLASSYNNLGTMYASVDQYELALKYHNKALTIREELLPPNHPSLAGSYTNIGIIHKKKGEYSEALSLYEKALTIQIQLLPSTRDDVASTYNNIANVYRNMDDYSKAFSFYEKAMVIIQQASFRDNHELARMYANMGRVHTIKHKCWKAHLYLQDAVDIAQSLLPPDHSHLQQRRSDLWYIRTQL